MREYNKRRYPEHKEQLQKQSREWIANNRERFRELSRRSHHKCKTKRNMESLKYNAEHKDEAHRAHLRRKYGITPEDTKSMLESQGGVCPICGQLKSKMCVDHCHSTGAVRGILCDRCNKGIGHFCDDPSLLEAAIRYLRK